MIKGLEAQVMLVDSKNIKGKLLERLLVVGIDMGRGCNCHLKTMDLTSLGN